MIVHKTIAMNSMFAALFDFAENAQKPQIILRIKKDALLVYASDHHMIHSAFTNLPGSTWDCNQLLSNFLSNWRPTPLPALANGAPEFILESVFGGSEGAYYMSIICHIIL